MYATVGGGQMVVLLIAVAFSMRYFWDIEKSAHIFADIQDLAFQLHGLNATHVPAIAALRAHVVANYLDHATVFRVHVLTTGLAWAIMPFQIWASFRKESYSRHRQLGWAAASLLSVGMFTSFFIARPMRECAEGGGMTSEVGFYGMAVATSLCAFMGIKRITEEPKDVDQHRVWMVRAYGCMWGSFFWFRIWMVVFLPILPPNEYPHGLGLISNLSWMVGWIGADLALSFADTKQATPSAQRTIAHAKAE
ncbi:unnamed protein product [Polarella glacialis]|uniref:Uncharacterized protein n=1 Tax=Polarella glacialis TaxID=89957 RepID=A0A813FKQ3_POLGL|nr:unnamed protein product [Polarella glacialis]